MTPEQAVAKHRGTAAFVAYFDVLTAGLAGKLSEGGPWVAVVLNPAKAVLPARTRAELAAALARVEAVVPVSGDPGEFLEALEPVKIVHWEREDALRTSKLIEHVQSLQNS